MLREMTVVKFNPSLLYNTFICWLVFQHIYALAVRHLQGAFLKVCSLCFNLHVRNSTND